LGARTLVAHAFTCFAADKGLKPAPANRHYSADAARASPFFPPAACVGWSPAPAWYATRSGAGAPDGRGQIVSFWGGGQRPWRQARKLRGATPTGEHTRSAGAWAKPIRPTVVKTPRPVEPESTGPSDSRYGAFTSTTRGRYCQALLMNCRWHITPGGKELDLPGTRARPGPHRSVLVPPNCHFSLLSPSKVAPRPTAKLTRPFTSQWDGGQPSRLSRVKITRDSAHATSRGPSSFGPRGAAICGGFEFHSREAGELGRSGPMLRRDRLRGRLSPAHYVVSPGHI